MLCPDSTSSLIEYQVPKLLYREGGLLDVPGESSRKGFETYHLDNLLNIWRTAHVQSALELSNSPFAFLPLLNMNSADAEKAFHGNATQRLFQAAEQERQMQRHKNLAFDDDFAASALRPFGLVRRPIPSNSNLPPSLVQPLDAITESYSRHSPLARPGARVIVPSAVAAPVRLFCNDGAFTQRQMRISRDPLLSQALFGMSPDARESETSVEALQRVLPGVPPIGLVTNSSLDQLPGAQMQVPQMNKLIVDSSKLARLDELLRELKAGGHRVLIYFQMTRMIDLMEEYLIYRQYKYLRLDGSSKISDRRDMVTDWQTK